ncbi:MAG: ankyrin repeat domain-containing protein [Acidobacteriota bacterium]
MPIRSLDRITIPAPCNADWDSMAGNDRVRFCEHCNLHVTDLSAMTRPAAMRLVARSQGRLCVRFVQRPDGGILTKAPEKLYRIGRRVSRIAAGAFSATLSVSSALAQTSVNASPNEKTLPSIARLIAGTSQGTEISGVVIDPNGALVAGALVTLINNKSSAGRVFVTADDGAYRFSLLETGSYSVIAEAASFDRSLSSELDLGTDEKKTVDLVLQVPQVVAEVEVTTRELVVMGGGVVREPDDPLVKAAFKDDLHEVVALIPTVADINANDKFADTNALAYAVENNNRDMVNVLISAGANPNSENKYGQTALMHLDAQATTQLVHDLIAAGAGVNAQDVSGETVLMRAANHCSFEVIKELIEAGAKIDAKDDDRNTVLMRAALNEDARIVKFLIKAGLSLDARNEAGESALYFAATSGKGENLRALIDAGATISPKSKEIAEAMVAAANNEDFYTVKILLDAGASAKASDGDRTVLMRAALNGTPQIIKALIDAGAEINAVDNDGWTALMHANEVENVRALLNAGADMTIRNKEGLTALAMAINSEQEAVVKLLKSRGAPE